MAGEILAKDGYVSTSYIDAMIERENMMTTYIGKGIAIPHGVVAGKEDIKRSGISILQFPEGVDFDGEKAYLVIGIAGVGDEHLGILANIAATIEEENEQMLEELRTTKNKDYMLTVFTSNSI